MDEYINKKEIIRHLCLTTGCSYHDVVIGTIMKFPAVDVQPVCHGRWIIADDEEHFIAVCSECGRTEDSRDIKDMPYCHCGARMDGDAE